MKARLLLLNWFNGKRPGETDVYRRLESILTRKGLSVECPQNLTLEGVDAVRRQLRDGDVLVCHQTEVSIHTDFTRCFCEPSGIPRRSQRLKFVEEHGLPVMDWADPSEARNPVELFERWKTDRLLLKRGHSFQSAGLTILERGGPFPQLEEGDVFCRLITHDPQTYKVDVFHDVVLGSYVKETPSILDPRFPEWIAGDIRNQHDFPHQNRHFFELPDDLEAAFRKLGRTLTSLGGGYSSIDMMNSPEGFRIIELNTSNVATEFSFLEDPDGYSANFAEGLFRLWSEITAGH